MEKTIVYAYVVADILHEGHLIALQNAKALGDRLIVGVLTDEAAMEKKPKPTISFARRLRIIEALDCVDAAVTQDTYSPNKNIDLIKPDILIESDSHTIEDLDKTSKICEFKGIRIIKMPYYPEQSSTKIKNDIRK